MSVMFIVPMNAPGLKMICRVSYEETANRTAHPFDYPLSSRFDENDAILVLDNVFVPWKTCWCCGMRRRSSPSTPPPASCTAIASRAASASL